MASLTRNNSRLAYALAWTLAAAPVLADPITDIQAPSVAGMRLQLELFINGRPANLIIEATALPDGELAVQRGELEDAGVRARGSGARSEEIILSKSGLAYRYDYPRQRIYFSLSDEQRVPKTYDSRGERPSAPQTAQSWGALLNYVLFASSSSSISHLAPRFSTVNASLDMRMSGPVGQFTQTGIVGNQSNYDLFRFKKTGGLRLDSTYTYVDESRLVAYRVGDIVTGGFEWTRPVRLGGAQIQKNFSIRPDLVTAPLPSISGSAAVPSTVEVFVNGARVMTQQVEEGPFRVTNLPVATSGGNAEVIIRDASGRERRSELSLFSGQRLLAEGLFDYTMEAGFSRRFYAFRSNQYDGHFVGSGGFRYGFSNTLTLETHAEGGAGVVNGGAAALFSLGPFGSIEGAMSGSVAGGRNGGQAYGSYSYVSPSGVNLNLSMQRAIGDYEDLASRTAFYANALPLVAQAVPAAASNLFGSFFGVYGLPPRAVDRVAIGAPVYGLGGSVSLALARITPRLPFSAPILRNLSETRLITASYSRPLPYDGNLFVTAYANFAGNHDRGLFVGVTFPLGEKIRATIGAQSVPEPLTGKTRLGAKAQLQKGLGSQIGDYGWTLSATAGQNSLNGANLSYRTSLGTARMDAIQQDRLISTTGQFEGAIGATSQGIAPGPTVYDAFAIVDAGASDVTVLQDNHPVGKTNVFGKLMVPNLRAYQPNKIAIDPNTLPPDAVASNTQKIVAPAFRSGVGVDFGVRTDLKSAMLILTDPSGKPIETGSRGRLEGGEAFVVGYDGRAFVRGVSEEESEIVVNLGSRDCRASFRFNPGEGKRHAIRATCE
ncbi:fimbria/pilus outer membrane usher protein [Methylocystis sp. JAN1]|uniref:fimbria/pilus outer membrane usher protein n=1 Tax=Methylocystis sp. JAN1 TaxID=3397211 RepID=UPI003FA3218D